MTTKTEHHSLSFNESAREVLGALYDYSVCERPDGSRYGTSGTCRMGKEVSPAEQPEKKGLVSRAKGLVKRAVRKVTRAEAREKAAAEEAARIREANEKAAKAKAERDRKKANTDNMINRVSKDLPAGAEAKSVGGTLRVSMTTRAGHKIEYNVSRSGNVDFTVNGTWDAGSVKDRRQQIEVALGVKRMHEAVVKNLRDGHTLWTQPYEEDGKGDARKKAYLAMGFSQPKGWEEVMVAQKGSSGKLEPSDMSSSQASRLVGEDQDFKEGEAEEVLLWYKAIFGEDLKRG